MTKRLLVIGLGLALAGCAGSVPEFGVVVPAFPPVILPHECWDDNPDEPVLPLDFGRLDDRAKERAALRTIEEKKLDRAQLAAWRMTCRASLRAQLRPSGPAPRKALDRPSS